MHRKYLKEHCIPRDTLLDENNRKIVDNDLIVIQNKFKKFCFRHTRQGLERENLSTFTKDDEIQSHVQKDIRVHIGVLYQI